jgi:hypothetical protein
MTTNHNLTPRQKAFADFYITGIPAGRAWTQAGYSSRGNPAEVQASQALKKPKFKAYIKAERARLEKAGEIRREDLVSWLVAVIRTPIGQVDADSPLCQEFSCEDIEGGTRTRIKMASKMDACRQLAQIMGWQAPEKIQIGAADKLAEIIGRIRRA